MKLSNFLNEIQQNQQDVVYYCAEHLLSKKYDIQNDSINESELKNLFTDYNEFNRLLNDSAYEIYKKYSSELDELYGVFCDIFNVDCDNESVYKHRFARVINQDAKHFLHIEDKDHQETVIQKFEDKINRILTSKYYKEHEEELSKDMILPQKTLEMIKSAASIA